MVRLTLKHSADLTPMEVAQAQALLEEAFAHLGPAEAFGPGPAEAGSVMVLPGGAALDLDGELVCDWRDGDVW